MRVLVIGGTGFIGPHVVRRLHDTGHEVTVFHRGQTETDLPQGIKHIHHPSGRLGDRTYFASFKAEFKRLAPHVVLDMIPMTEQDAHVFMATFRRIAHRVVALSSQDVYLAYGKLRGLEPGVEEPMPITEDAPLRQRHYPYRSEPPRKPEDQDKYMDDYDKTLVERVVMRDPALPGIVPEGTLAHPSRRELQHAAAFGR